MLNTSIDFILWCAGLRIFKALDSGYTFINKALKWWMFTQVLPSITLKGERPFYGIDIDAQYLTKWQTAITLELHFERDLLQDQRYENETAKENKRAD